MPQRRQHSVTVRLSNPGLVAVDTWINEFPTLARAAVIRAMMAVATNHERELRTQLAALTAGDNL